MVDDLDALKIGDADASRQFLHEIRAPGRQRSGDILVAEFWATGESRPSVVSRPAPWRCRDDPSSPVPAQTGLPRGSDSWVLSSRFPSAGHPCIEHLGDVWMVHHGQRLALGFEAGDYLLGIHAKLDDLERDATAHRFGL